MFRFDHNERIKILQIQRMIRRKSGSMSEDEGGVPLTEKIRKNGLSLAETASKSLTSLISLKEKVSPRLFYPKESVMRKSSESMVTEEVFYDCENSALSGKNSAIDTGLVELKIKDDKKYYVSVFTSTENVTEYDLRQIRRQFSSGQLLETFEKNETDIFIHMQIEEDDIPTIESKNFKIKQARYEQLNIFSPVLLPTNKHMCILIQSFAWRQDCSMEFFIKNWAQLRTKRLFNNFIF